MALNSALRLYVAYMYHLYAYHMSIQQPLKIATWSWHSADQIDRRFKFHRESVRFVCKNGQQRQLFIKSPF